MPAETCKTILLTDKPAETDAFAGSHDRLASALADLIRNEEGGRAAALTGNWGSGKSTTIQLLKSRLANKAEVFVFNAWSHQGDPLRRTFLEQLIDFVNSRGWLNDHSYWEDVKKDLARTRKVQDIKSTPVLNRAGKALAILLLLIPLGLVMFGRLGTGRWWVILLGALLALAPAAFVVAVFIYHWSRGDKTEIFEILLKQATVTTKSETIETPEPTSIEFQTHFRNLLASCLNTQNRRLVIVIDNLDRIDADNALALWSTMSTFFDFNSSSDCEWLKSLWLIVPFDPSALARLWPDALEAAGTNEDTRSGATDELARVFVDKTFAITFHVPPPVRSDWRSYLIDQLKQALPQHAERADEEFHVVYRIFQLAGLRESRSPTPRDIKIFVNNIGAIHRQRGDEISLGLQALYVTLSSRTWDLEEKLRTAKDEQLLGSIPISFVGADFRASLAAIYFNAPVEKALQLLHGEKTESALLSGNPDQLKAFENINGITQVIEDKVTDSAAEWVKSDASSLALAARALNGSGFEQDSSLTEAWRMLCEATGQVKSWPRLSSEVGEGIVAIFNHHKQEDLAKSIVASLAKSSTGNGKADAPEEPIDSGPWVATVLNVLKSIQSEFPQVLQNFSVPGSAANYLAAMSEVGKAGELTGMASFFLPSVALKDVIDELIKSSTDGKFDDPKANAVRVMLSTKEEWPWPKLIEQLKTRLNAENSPNVSEIKASLLTLLSLRSIQPEAAKALTFLAQQGHLEHQLYQSNQAKDQKAVALCVFPIMETIPNGTPTQTPGNASAGQNIYTEFIGSPSTNPELVTETAALLLQFGKTEALFALAKNSDTKAVAQAVLKEIAAGPKAHEQITPKAILENFDILRSICGRPPLEELVKKSIADASLITELTKAGFKTEMSDLYQIVLSCDKENPELLDFLEAGLKGIEKETWSSELSSEGYLIRLLIELVNNGRSLDLEIPFQDALLAHAKDILEGKVKVETLRSQWQQVPKALSQSFQETFFRRITEHLFSDSPTDPFLELYGEPLLNESILRENAERLVLTAFTNFLSRESLTELNWTVRAFHAAPNLLSEVNAATKKDFNSRVKDAFEKNLGNEPVRKEIEQIANLANFKLPAPKEKAEDDKKEKKKDESK